VLVERIGGGKRHAQLFRAIFVPGQVLADLPVCTQQFRNLVVLDSGIGWCFEGFDHPVDGPDPVVDNVEADPEGTEVAGYLEVGAGRFEVAARVVVDDDITWTTGLENCGDGIAVAAGEDLQFDDNLFRIGVADAENFIAAGLENFLAQLRPGCR
jgi:hypothetical protein